ERDLGLSRWSRCGGSTNGNRFLDYFRVEVQYRREVGGAGPQYFRLRYLFLLDLRGSERRGKSVGKRFRDDVRKVWLNPGNVGDGRDRSLAHHRLEFVRQLTDARIRGGQTSSFVERVPSVRAFTRI